MQPIVYQRYFGQWINDLAENLTCWVGARVSPREPRGSASKRIKLIRLIGPS